MAYKVNFLAFCIWLTVRLRGEQTVCALEVDNGNKTGSSDFLEDKLLTRIAFGSCMNGMFTTSKWYKQPQVVWKQIQAHQPDLWIWLGDAAYTDTRVLPTVWRPSPLSLMAEYFRRQKEHPDYQEFLRSDVRVLGIWDDHDYGFNNGGKHFTNRLQTQDIYLDFIDEPANSLRRKREGLYVSYTFGKGDKAVKLILLDVRSFAVYGEGCDLLGSEQWAWLAEQLSDSTRVAFTIITSGIQILSNAPVFQNWDDCPQSYDRLIWLSRQREKVVYLSGDVHFAEFACLNSFSSGYPIYELTSSGLWTVCTIPLVKPAFCEWIVRNVIGNDYRIKDPIVERNFGFIEINWNSKPIQIKLQIFGEQNYSISELTLNLDHIQKRPHAEYCPKFDSPRTYTYWLFLWFVILVILSVVTFALLYCICKCSSMVLRGLDRKSTTDLKIKEKNS